MRLVKPDKHLVDDIHLLRNDMVTSDEANGASWLEKSDDIFEWIEFTKKLESSTDPNYVPCEQFLIYVGEQIVGCLNIRHQLNVYLLNFGGHIGYYTIKKHRGKGYMTKAMELALDYIKNNLDISKVLVTCDDKNIGSTKVIKRVGGVLENKVESDGGKVTRRYWVHL